ncbi:phosphoesterase, partial [Halorubrum ezzemoulense]|nr:phosphoesterase [Halorubrum ezzemoulense]
MARVEPVVGEPAAVADLGAERALLVADVHAGIEVGLRYERGVELDSRADERRERLC